MKRQILTKIIAGLLLTLSLKSQTYLTCNSVKSDLIAYNANRTNRMRLIDRSSTTLNLNTKQFKYNTNTNDQMRAGGLAVLFAGIGFTTAAILESGDGKFYEGEVARGIMLGVGIGLTITGGSISLKYK